MSSQRKPLTAHQAMLVQWGTHDWARRSEEIGAQHPVASLAAKMYPQANNRLSDHERGSVSPLNGVAQPAKDKR
jgi:hypothetical protein